MSCAACPTAKLLLSILSWELPFVTIIWINVISVQCAFSKLKIIFSLNTALLVKSEPMEVDAVDSEKASPVETLKKPAKQVPVKKEVSDEVTLSNLLSATSMV